MTIELAVTVISLFVGLATLCNFFIGKHAATHKKGEEYGKLLNDVEHIKNGVDDLRDSIKSIQTDVRNHERRLVKVEESAKSIHKRLDAITPPPNGFSFSAEDF